MLAVPILIQVYFNSGLAYWLNRRFGEAHCVAAPSALIGASNFFELAVATAIGLFGFNSGAALATVVGSRCRGCSRWCASPRRRRLVRAGAVGCAPRRAGAPSAMTNKPAMLGWLESRDATRLLLIGSFVVSLLALGSRSSANTFSGFSLASYAFASASPTSLRL